MKKSFRVLTMALAAVMILSTAAIGASAAPYYIPGFTILFGDDSEKRDEENLDGFYWNDPIEVKDKDVKVTKDNYLSIVKFAGELYEFQGIGFNVFPDSQKIEQDLKTAVTIKGNQKDSYYQDLG